MKVIVVGCGLNGYVYWNERTMWIIAQGFVFQDNDIEPPAHFSYGDSS